MSQRIFFGSPRSKAMRDMERDPVRAEALQHVREVIQSGKYLGKTASSKESDRFVSYHYFQKEIPMKDDKGRPRKLTVDVGKKKDGAMEYRAHNFVHNNEPHYGKKVANPRGQGLEAEDKAVKKTGSIPRHGYSRPNQEKRLPTYEEIINPVSSRVNADVVALDRASRRRIDENGFLHVAVSHISKETVNPYYGREVPGWSELGIDPDKIYQGYRAGVELAGGADTFNGLPLLLGHFPESADDPQKKHRIGSLGTDAAFTGGVRDQNEGGRARSGGRSGGQGLHGRNESGGKRDRQRPGRESQG